MASEEMAIEDSFEIEVGRRSSGREPARERLPCRRHADRDSQRLREDQEHAAPEGRRMDSSARVEVIDGDCHDEEIRHAEESHGSERVDDRQARDARGNELSGREQDQALV